jgi:hypothetical protein
MLAGPKAGPFPAPKEPPPVEPGHRGQLARLIRERPVFVNVAGRHGRRSPKHLDWSEYIEIFGVFQGKDSGTSAFTLDGGTRDISDP